MGKKWIANVVDPSKKGLTHRQLGVPKNKKLPKTFLQEIKDTPIGETAYNPTRIGKRKIKVTHLAKKRATLALTLRNLSDEL